MNEILEIRILATKELGRIGGENLRLLLNLLEEKGYKAEITHLQIIPAKPESATK